MPVLLRWRRKVYARRLIHIDHLLTNYRMDVHGNLCDEHIRFMIRGCCSLGIAGPESDDARR